MSWFLLIHMVVSRITASNMSKVHKHTLLYTMGMCGDGGGGYGVRVCSVGGG